MVELLVVVAVYTSLLSPQKVELSTKIMADIVESFMAVLSLDQGIQKMEQFLEKHIFPKLQVSYKV